MIRREEPRVCTIGAKCERQKLHHPGAPTASRMILCPCASTGRRGSGLLARCGPQ